MKETEWWFFSARALFVCHTIQLLGTLGCLSKLNYHHSAAQASRSSSAILDKNTKMNMTKSQVLQNHRGASIPFSLKMSKYKTGRRDWKRSGRAIIWRDDPWLAQVHWNILQPSAITDHQSSFKASICTIAGYSTLIWPFAAYFKNQLY